VSALLAHVQSIVEQHRSLMGSESLCSLCLQFAKSVLYQRGAAALAIYAYLSKHFSRKSGLLEELDGDISRDSDSIRIGLLEQIFIHSFLLGREIEVGMSCALSSVTELRNGFRVWYVSVEGATHLNLRYRDFQPSLRAVFSIIDVKHARGLFNAHPCDALRRVRESAVGALSKSCTL
jgi:hypothetical protein